MGDINGHGEVISWGTYGFLTTDDREKGKYEFRRYLKTGGGIESTQGGRYPGCRDVHRQETSDGGSVGGPPAHILSMHATRCRLQGGGEYTTPMVAADGGRRAIEGHVRRYLVRSNGADITVIWKACQKGGLYGLG